jgi:uncharacterized protein YjbI with pentapeptide repeats
MTVNLSNTNPSNTNPSNTNLSFANLSDSNFSDAIIINPTFDYNLLVNEKTNFTDAIIDDPKFIDYIMQSLLFLNVSATNYKGFP